MCSFSFINRYVGRLVCLSRALGLSTKYRYMYIFSGGITIFSGGITIFTVGITLVDVHLDWWNWFLFVPHTVNALTTNVPLM